MNNFIYNIHIYAYMFQNYKVVFISIFQIRKWKLYKVKLKALKDLPKVTMIVGNRAPI